MSEIIGIKLDDNYYSKMESNNLSVLRSKDTPEFTPYF